MSAVVLDVMRTIEKMDDNSAKAVFDWLSNRFQQTTQTVSWDDIEEVEPDEIDIEMMKEIENNPDCKEFVSEDEMFSRLLANRR
ncbi:MAG: hypothetical protein FWB80_11650 [Defluviitaleaceae bacterium]|nr:hypothetical protein [Defluviitaleaceae bacterium]